MIYIVSFRTARLHRETLMRKKLIIKIKKIELKYVGKLVFTCIET